MARVVSNLVVQGLSGSLGNQVMIRRLRDGRTIVCAKPDFSQRKFSRGQKDHQSRFKEAAAYARVAAKTQPIYAQLAAGTMKTAYNIALSDWFNPPVIRRVERIEGVIRVQASDNVMVAQVQVSILGRDGAVLEEGQAVKVDGLWWQYESACKGSIVARAKDLAGNVAEFSP